jgi:hypothetical protein
MLCHVTRIFVKAASGAQVWLLVAIAGCAAGASGAAFANGPNLDAAKAPAVSQTVTTRALDRRVKAFTKALDLDARQQAELRKILERQRDAVRKIWSDSGLPPAERGPATLAVSDRTAGLIREMLTDEQRKKYNPPKPPAARNSAQPDVSVWMTATRPK